jgi:hypothetical protein
MPYDDRIQRQRAALITVFGVVSLTALALAGLFLVCGGLAVYVLAVPAVLGVVGLVHYLLWGRGLNQEVAGEREEYLLGEQFGDDEWPAGPRYPPHDLS